MLLLCSGAPELAVFLSSVSWTCFRRCVGFSWLLLGGFGTVPGFFAFAKRAFGVTEGCCDFTNFFGGVVVLFLGFLVCRVVVVVEEGCRLCFSVLFDCCEDSAMVDSLVARDRCKRVMGYMVMD